MNLSYLVGYLQTESIGRETNILEEDLREERVLIKMQD